MKIIRLPDWYGSMPIITWLDSMTPPSKGLRGGLGKSLLNDLRLYRPDDTTENHKPMPVILAPGKHIAEHKHPEWTLIYFIDAEEVQLAIGGGDTGNEPMLIYPANNTAILLPPGTPHSVRINTMDRPRLSLALRFKND